jgi:hypothetical protein
LIAGHDLDWEQAMAAAEPVGLECTIMAVTCFSRRGAGLSGGDLVLVRESAEDLFPADPVLGKVDRLRSQGVSLIRWQGQELWTAA